jgi:hypothetical protein
MAIFNPQAAMSARASGRHIDAADVIALLREVYAEGIVTREEAEELIVFDQSLADPTPGWTDFFATTIADHVVARQAPPRIVDDEKTAWLTGALGKGRHAATPGGFAAVLRLIEIAPEVSAALVAAYAIRQVRSAVLAGRRPASTVRLFMNRAIDPETAALVRRVMTGGTAQSARPVSRAEAEALFDLHDLTASGANDADFEDLFFKSVVHHLLSESGQAVPPRREALARNSEFPRKETSGKLLGGDETAWLASSIMRDGRPTTAEFRLLQFFGGSTASTQSTLPEFTIQAA